MSLEPGIPLRCQCRRHEVTSLRCSRCSVAICPHCSHSVPAGFVCNSCFRGKPIHIFEVGTTDLLRALGASLLVSTIGGWLLATNVSLGAMVAVWGGVLMGAGVSEACLRATSRKRGPKIEIIVGGSIVFGCVLGCLLEMIRSGVPPEVYLTTPYTFFMLVLAVVVGVGRIRSF